MKCSILLSSRTQASQLVVGAVANGGFARLIDVRSGRQFFQLVILYIKRRKENPL
jgi:hypothetical protein